MRSVPNRMSEARIDMTRQRVLGLPIGKQRRSRGQMAKAAGAAVATLAAPAVAVPVAKRVGKLAHRAGNAVNKGQEMAGQASDMMDTASNVKDAVSSHSSTIGKVGGVISALGGKAGGGGKPKLSHLIEQHTNITVPRSVAYNQWTQLEMFPRITKGIESAQQESDEKSKWTSKIGPSRRSWTGHVVEQIPDERIAWKSEGGASIQGVVTFHSLDQDLTRVLLQMEYKPTGAFEWVGNTLRIQRRRAKRDLRLFKHFLELRGEETGAWRGEIDEDKKLEPQFAGQEPPKGAGRSRSHAGGTSKHGASRSGRGSNATRSTGASKRGASSRPSANGRSSSGRPRTTSSRRPSPAPRSNARESNGNGSSRRRDNSRRNSS